MPEKAEQVSAKLLTNRNCTVEITNVSSNFCLTNPKVYMVSGFSQHPPQPTICTAKTEVCSFTKDDNTVTGSVGLMTYDIFHMQKRQYTERMAIMFSVPFDRNLYKNKLAIGIFEHSQECDKQLYTLMYEGKDMSNFVRADTNGSGLVFQGAHLDVRATMSTVGRAIVKVELYDIMGR
ncbi:bryoporin-like [Boleophthalmus pectinirostris]|uniref:bryoporin-like n=1 Tax=Boleophthalmus pectinirostris TaxID=150288 RepID=UPI000A1C2053|nr:bryoporin-like [Boleophthalmus pectinirostris]